jgi:hypothetical protein
VYRNFKPGIEQGKILYSCGNPRESSEIFYDVHFIEYAIFNKSKKVSFYFGVGKRLQIEF